MLIEPHRQPQRRLQLRISHGPLPPPPCCTCGQCRRPYRCTLAWHHRLEMRVCGTPRLALPRLAASNRAPHRIAALRTTHVFDMWHPSGVSCALSLSYETNFRYQVVALSISISTLLPHGNDSSSACDYLKLCFNFKRPPFFFWMKIKIFSPLHFNGNSWPGRQGP